MAQNGSASILASALKPIAAGSSQMQVTREPGATASGSGSNNAASSAGPSRGRLAVRGRGRGVAEEDVNMSDSSTGSRGGRKGKRGSAARRSGGPVCFPRPSLKRPTPRADTATVTLVGILERGQAIRARLSRTSWAKHAGGHLRRQAQRRTRRRKAEREEARGLCRSDRDAAALCSAALRPAVWLAQP